VVIVGPNGSGKTSLLMMILGALAPRRGRILLDDALLFDGARAVDVPVERRRIGFVPQRYALFPHLDVRGNVLFGVTGLRGEARERRAREVLSDLDAAALAARRPTELSGGEMQRVAIARGLSQKPRLLLCDEPTGHLDTDTTARMLELIDALQSRYGFALVVATHDADVAAGLGRVIELRDGRIVEDEG